MIVTVDIQHSKNPYCPTSQEYCKDVVDIHSADLFSVSDLFLTPIQWRKYTRKWWTNIPDGELLDSMRFGNVSGEVLECSTTDRCYAVRPVLRIDIVVSEKLSVGDVFYFGDRLFVVISRHAAFCLSDIGDCAYRMHREELDCREYCASDIKRVIDDWFMDSMSQCEESSDDWRMTQLECDEDPIKQYIDSARKTMTDKGYRNFLHNIKIFVDDELVKVNMRMIPKLVDSPLYISESSPLTSKQHFCSSVNGAITTDNCGKCKCCCQRKSGCK